MRTPLLFLLCCPLMSFAQRFTLEHVKHGLGSTLNQMYERLSIRDSLLVLTYKFKTGEVAEDDFGNRYAVTKDTTFTAVFRQSSADSIRALLTGLENTRISGSNLCVKSGAIVTLDVCCDGKPTAFWLENTYDSTALAIVTIVNAYLPEALQLHVPYNTWEIARTCEFARSTNRKRPIGEERFPK